jgi:hypothetical protein
MAKKKRDQFPARCPGCGVMCQPGELTEHIAYYQCSRCTCRFRLTLRRPTRADLEQKFLDEDGDSSTII